MPSLTERPVQRVAGIDSLRFICALWVTIGHVGLTTPQWDLWVQTTYPLFRPIIGLLINAPAAVIVFFVISGFCIHFPFREGGHSFHWGEFYVRRLLRIGLPLLAASYLADRFHAEIPIWSLYAEIVYYLLYPFFFLVAARWGWKSLLFFASLGSACVVASSPWDGNYPSYPYWNWLLGLPCWILGCVLASRVHELKENITRLQIWTWRLAVWGVSSVALVLRFHSCLGYPLTLNFFGLLVFFWLRKEITYWQSHQPLRFLEWAGKWSYSLYLIHMIELPKAFYWAAGGLGLWAQKYAFAFLISYLFYRAVEYPSHRIAQKVGKYSTRLEWFKTLTSARF